MRVRDRKGKQKSTNSEEKSTKAQHERYESLAEVVFYEAPSGHAIELMEGAEGNAFIWRDDD